MRLTSALAAALLATPFSSLFAVPAPVRDAVPAAAQLFELRDVRLLESPFQTAMQTDKDYLLSLDADRLLAWFRKESGLAPKGKVYEGWESRGVAGHSLGHYLSALAMMYAATGDEKLRDRAAYIVDELAACQSANGNGYVGAIPDGKKIFAELAAGNVRPDGGFNLNGGWVPWYTMHKIFAGLLDVQHYCNSAKAGEVVGKLTDWCANEVEKLNDEQMQRMLSVEQGGMAESLAEVYARTGNPRTLATAKKFRDNSIFDPIAHGRDTLDGQHGNMNIPKFIGYDRIYELTGEPDYGAAARNFWHFVAEDRAFVIGGHGVDEHFFPVAKFAQYLRTANGPETCNSYNMLKLTEHLFCERPESKLADFYERALYNHILSSELPHAPGALVYYSTMREGSYRGYSQPFSDFWCCVGTGMENHAKYGRFIYAKAGNRLLVNLFVPSELKWGDVTVTQQNQFPAEPKTSLRFTVGQPRRFPVAVRYPYWVAPGSLKVAVNGEALDAKPVSSPAGYVEVEREWKTGDTLTVDLPMALHTELLPHSDEYAAFLYGPIVLAGQLGRDGMKDSDFRRQSIDEKKVLPAAKVPVLVASVNELPAHLDPVAGQPLTFRTRDLAKPDEVTLAPFYSTHQQRYAVYWKLSTPEHYAEQLRETEAAEKRQQALLARTIDHVEPSQQQPEVDHGFAGEKSSTGSLQDLGWRDAKDGGWFSYRLKVNPDRPASLLCKFWGSDGGQRVFEILVDGRVVATPSLRAEHPGEFFDAEFPIPADLTRGKREVTVKFQSHSPGFAGGIFGLRTVETK